MKTGGCLCGAVRYEVDPPLRDVILCHCEMCRKAHGAVPVRHDRSRLKLAGGLIGMFVLGGVAGAVGFKFIGFVCVVPLAALLLALSVPPLIRDAPRSMAMIRMLGRLPARDGGGTGRSD